MNSIDRDRARNLYKGGEPLKNYQVYLDSAYWDSFEEEWQAMQYIDENIDKWSELATEEREAITVRIYDENDFRDCYTTTLLPKNVR